MKKVDVTQQQNNDFVEFKIRKKHLILGCCFMIVLAVVGVSFASYTIESEGYVIVNSQVGDFSASSSDIQIAVLVDGVEQDTFPAKESGYVFESLTCENDSSGTWDSTNWKLGLDVYGPDECTVSFIEIRETLASEYITSLLSSNTATMNNDDVDGNVRYMGANPNNYVTFNDESWRIIGVFDVAPSASGTKEERVKLIRTDNIGNYSWDSSTSGVNGGVGVNEWSQADLMTTLNSGAYYNRTSSTCYDGTNNSKDTCDFSSTGLTSEAKTLISNAYWHLGTTTKDWSSSSNRTETVPQMYSFERSANKGKICSSGTYCTDSVTRTTGWVGKVGLMYPSDYGYSTSGGSTTSRATCLSTALNSWSNSSDCYSNSWLFNSSSTQWTMTPVPHSSSGGRVFFVHTLGNSDHDNASYAHLVHPVVYLDASVMITGGNGTSGNPYTLSI